MRPWDLVDHEPVPHSDARVYLMSRGGVYAIHVDGRELMSTTLHGSEDALADLACDQLEDLPTARVLVGGLGMGFTAAAVLRRLGADGRCVVAELLPAVVRWNREVPALSRAAGRPLLDPRVTVYEGDVGDLIENPPAPWSAILLDVDNGPRSLTRPSNGWLYTDEGLDAAWAALRAGGVLAIWSVADDASLTDGLQVMGFEVKVAMYTEAGRPTPDGSGTHVVWTARRPPDADDER
jgi:spermidine synthase